MERRTFVITACKAFPVVVGALYLIDCGGPTAPSSVAEVTSDSTVVNGHSHTVNVSASDQLHPAGTTYTSSTASAHNHMVSLTADQLSTIASGGSVAISSTASTADSHEPSLHSQVPLAGCWNALLNRSTFPGM